jgi:hypothetical protein
MLEHISLQNQQVNPKVFGHFHPRFPQKTHEISAGFCAGFVWQT